MSTILWTGTAGDGNWGTVSNWSTGAVPITGDNVYFVTGTDQIILGLNQSAVTLASLTFYPGFTGQIGVAGPTGASLQIGATIMNMLGGGTNNSGNSSGVLGSGGIQLFKWTPASVAFTANIESTGVSADTFGSAVQIYGGTSGSTLYVTGGTVDVAMVPGQTATLASASVGGNGVLFLGPGVTCPIVSQTGTTTSVYASCAVTTLTNISGSLETAGTGEVTTLVVGGAATLNNRASGVSWGTITVNTSGSVDFSQNPAPATITNAIQMYANSTLTTFSKSQIQLAGSPSATPLQVVAEGCGIGALSLNLGTQGQTITIA